MIENSDSDQVERLNSRVAELLAEVAALKRHAQRELDPVAWRYQRKIGWGDIWRCSTVPVNFETPDHWIVEPIYALTPAQPHPTENMPADGGGK